MKIQLLLLASWFGLFTAECSAAPAPMDTRGAGRPTVTLQVKSIAELLGTLKTTAKTCFPETMRKEIERDLLSELNPDKIKGVALNKPFGLYANLGEGLMQRDFSKSSVVALVPIADEKAFLELFGKWNLPIEKKGDVYSIPIPAAPIKVTIRFRKDYAFIIAATEEVDPKTLLEPADLFDEPEKAALALRIRTDRMPNDLRKAGKDFLSVVDKVVSEGVAPQGVIFGLGGMEMIVLTFLSPVAPMFRMAIEDDVNEVAYRLHLDAKTGVLTNEFAATPAKGSAIAKSISRIRPTQNEFADIVGADSAAHVLIQTPLFLGTMKSILCKGVDTLGKMADSSPANKDAPEEVRTAIRESFKTLRRTLDDGVFDLAVSLRGPDKKDQYTVVGAVSVKDPSDLEKALKAALPVAPKELREVVELDAFKVNGVQVHEIAVGELLPAETQKAFGKSSLYVAAAPNAVFIAFGVQSKSIITETLANKRSSKPAPLVQVEISSKRLIPLFKNYLGSDPEAMQYLEHLGKTDRQPVWAVKVEGGERLVIQWEIGLAGFYAMMPKVKKTAAVGPNAAPAKIGRRTFR